VKTISDHSNNMNNNNVLLLKNNELNNFENWKTLNDENIIILSPIIKFKLHLKKKSE